MEQIIELIQQYGVTVVLFGVLIFINICIFKRMAKRGEDLDRIEKEREERDSERDKAYQLQQEKMTELLVVVARNTKHGHTADEEECIQNRNNKINIALDHLRDDLDADRACCFLYHNGGYSITGMSFLKMTMMFEKISSNVMPVMGYYRDVPRTMFPILTQKIAEQGLYYIKDIKDIEKEDPITYQSFVIRGTNSAYALAMKNIEGALLGFICVEFIKGETKSQKLINEKLKRAAIKISGILDGSEAVGC